VVAGPAEALTQVLKPFVFRKYLDFNAYASMRDLKVQIQRDVAQRGLDDNIKLGRGGIREVEFIAQVFQLIRGGQDADLQIKPTLEVLGLLQQQGVLSADAVNALSESYIYLRNVEHRLMYIDDQQTQDLPKSEANQQRLIAMTGHPNWSDFLTELSHHRARIQAHFDATFCDAEQQDFAEETALWEGTLSTEIAHDTLSSLGYSDAHETYARIQRLSASSRYLQLPEQSKQRFNQLMPIVIHQAALASNADDAFLRTINLLETNLKPTPPVGGVAPAPLIDNKPLVTPTSPLKVALVPVNAPVRLVVPVTCNLKLPEAAPPIPTL
jgi:glutamate-ammonia-ligase adenylyltransferase